MRYTFSLFEVSNGVDAQTRGGLLHMATENPGSEIGPSFLIQFSLVGSIRADSIPRRPTAKGGNKNIFSTAWWEEGAGQLLDSPGVL